MNLLEDLVKLIFPDINLTIEDLEKRYPARNLKDGARVTRFAPSPTGFLHTGSLFTSLVAFKVAKDSGGVFYTRLEDTDTKREIKGSGDLLIKQLHEFGIDPDEGYFGTDKENGVYGPYKQSDRKEIYETVIKDMLLKGTAYVDFATPEELDAIREEQTANKEITGYYGKYAKYRDLSIEEVISKVKNNEPYVIRFKSTGDHSNKIKVHDEIRGDLELTQNDQDIVILKSDGLPTYHFAHVCDDHFMHTTHITRGEEWLPSLPIHLEMFRSLGWKAPKYAHLPVIMKMDNGTRRKLSKRKDPEASVDFFLESGYEPKSLLVYLMTIANSNYEDYIVQSKNYDLSTFKFNLNKMSLDGALFDIDKLNFYGKEVLGAMNKDEIFDKSYAWAKHFSKDLLTFIESNKEQYKEILNIEREKKNPRKDYAKYGDIYENIKFFNHDEFLKITEDGFDFSKNINPEIVINLLKDYKGHYCLNKEENDRYNEIKVIGAKYNFCTDSKLYKQNPDAYLGSMNDICEIIRVVVSGRKVTPNLFSILKILGEIEIDNRIDLAIRSLV
jgi:glutamyl-tRNA synthetase